MELSTIYQNETEDKFLNIIKDIKLKDYVLTKTKENFFIWKKNKGTHYIRLCLIRTGHHEKTLFYWNLERDFIPFSYKHNHRKLSNIKSYTFKANETDKFYNYFLNLVEMVKLLN